MEFFKLFRDVSVEQIGNVQLSSFRAAFIAAGPNKNVSLEDEVNSFFNRYKINLPLFRSDDVLDVIEDVNERGHDKLFFPVRKYSLVNNATLHLFNAISAEPNHKTEEIARLKASNFWAAFTQLNINDYYSPFLYIRSNEGIQDKKNQNQIDNAVNSLNEIKKSIGDYLELLKPEVEAFNIKLKLEITEAVKGRRGANEDQEKYFNAFK